MSDVARVYSGTKRTGGTKRRRLRRISIRRKGRFFGGVFGGIALFLAFWFLWTTRDSYPMRGLIPADQTYHVFVTGLLTKRQNIAASPVWTLAPETSSAAKVPALLQDNFGMPDWVLNNIAYGASHISGHDAGTFGDVLFVTKMSRIGCLVERFHRFVGVSDDYAGGLELRYLPDAGVYYAVRGRMLIASPSRETVVRSLTLRPDEAIANDELMKGTREAGDTDLCGRFLLRPEDPAGDVLTQLRVVARMEPAGVAVVIQGTLREPWRARLAGILDNAKPVDLEMPSEGLFEVSANFGCVLSEFSKGIVQAIDETGRLSESCATYITSPPGDLPPGIGPIVAQVLSPAGPGWRVCWRGIDINEMFPTPELVGTVDMAPEMVEEIFSALPKPPATSFPWDPWPRIDETHRLLYVPALGGPAIEPCAAAYGGKLLISTSRRAAESVFATSPTSAEMLPEKGNLFLRLRPFPAMKAVTDAGLELARNHLITGQTAESFPAVAAAWLERAERIHEISLLAAHQDGEISLKCRVVMAAPKPEAPPV